MPCLRLVMLWFVGVVGGQWRERMVSFGDERAGQAVVQAIGDEGQQALSKRKTIGKVEKKSRVVLNW